MSELSSTDNIGLPTGYAESLKLQPKVAEISCTKNFVLLSRFKLEEIAALDAESADVLATIKALL